MKTAFADDDDALAVVQAVISIVVVVVVVLFHMNQMVLPLDMEVCVILAEHKIRRSRV